MKKEKQPYRVIKEEEKIRQVTHWDLDYLSTDQINDLYQRKSGHHQPINGMVDATDESNTKLSLLLIVTGLLLLAGTLFFWSLM